MEGVQGHHVESWASHHHRHATSLSQGQEEARSDPSNVSARQCHPPSTTSEDIGGPPTPITPSRAYPLNSTSTNSTRPDIGVMLWSQLHMNDFFTTGSACTRLT